MLIQTKRGPVKIPDDISPDEAVEALKSLGYSEDDFNQGETSPTQNETPKQSINPFAFATPQGARENAELQQQSGADITKNALSALLSEPQRLATGIGKIVEPAAHYGYEQITGKKVPHYPVEQTTGMGEKPLVDYNKLVGLSPDKVSPILQDVVSAGTAGPSVLSQALTNALFRSNEATPDQQNLGGYLPQGAPGAALQGAAEPIALVAAGKLASYVPTAGRYIHELFSPKALSDRLAEEHIKNIQKIYPQIVAKQQEAYNYPIKKYGNESVIKSNYGGLKTQDATTFLGWDKKLIDELPPKSKTAYINFKNDPIVSNLHDLQSQLGKDGYGINPKIDKAKYNLITQAAEDTKSKLMNFFKNKTDDPLAYEKYKQGSNITAKWVKPFERTEPMRKIVENRIEPGERSFNQLKQMVQTAKESKKGIPKNHPLADILDKMQNQSKMIENRKIIPKILDKTLKYGPSGILAEEILRNYVFHRK